jgi:predicted SAM-dependent methyltransferase
MKLDIGCGQSKRAGFVGLDILPLPGVDVVHDLNAFPYPFEDSTFEEIWADQVLEHVQNPLRTVEEIWRIATPDSVVRIGVPYFRSHYAVIDPTHRNFFGVQWFDYFDPSKELCARYAYSASRFQIVSIEFDREFKQDMSWHHRFVARYAERRPLKYEASLSHLYPLNSLTFTLKARK